MFDGEEIAAVVSSTDAAAQYVLSSSTDTDESKVDSITALQDAVDSLSLAMFEALRGLRDAVAPESGNLGGDGGNNQNENHEPDLEEFWQNYRGGDPTTVAMVQKISPIPPKKREDYTRIYAKIESLRDAALVKRLAETVLEKSADIDHRVSSLPGMHRTKSQQMEHIKELLEKNQETNEKLEETFNRAKERRDIVRTFVKDNTCVALLIEDSDQ